MAEFDSLSGQGLSPYHDHLGETLAEDVQATQIYENSNSSYQGLFSEIDPVRTSHDVPGTGDCTDGPHCSITHIFQQTKQRVASNFHDTPQFNADMNNPGKEIEFHDEDLEDCFSLTNAPFAGLDIQGSEQKKRKRQSKSAPTNEEQILRTSFGQWGKFRCISPTGKDSIQAVVRAVNQNRLDAMSRIKLLNIPMCKYPKNQQFNFTLYPDLGETLKVLSERLRGCKVGEKIVIQIEKMRSIRRNLKILYINSPKI